MALPGPQLLSPAQNAEVVSDAITFTWQEVPEARAYWVQVAIDPAFATPLLDMYVGTGGSMTMYELPVVSGQMLYWRMRTRDESGWGAYGEPAVFRYVVPQPERIAVAPGPVPATTRVTEAPMLISPEPDAPVDGAAATFAWQAVPGARSYYLQVAQDATFGQLAFDGPVGESTSLTLFETLPRDGSTLYWRVRAGDHEGWRAWSDTGTFVATSDDELERYVAERARRSVAAAKIEARKVLDNTGDEPFRRGTTSKSLATATLAVMLVSFVVLMAVLVQLALNMP